MTHYHFIGIGGTGLSAIARVLLEQGEQVSGSDRVLSPLAAALREAGAEVYIGHDAQNIRGADMVIRSSAVPDDNVEVEAALSAGVPVLKRADFLGSLMRDKVGLAVAGTHGKTTTSGMLSWVLYDLGLDPTFILGGVMQNLGVNARAGGGPHFVIEADEYDRMFLGLKPKIAFVTNVEHDHPDCYPTFMDMMNAFEQFVARLPFDGTLIACADDAGANAMINKARSLGRRTIAYRLSLGGKTLASPEWLLGQNVRANEQGGVSLTVVSNVKPQLLRGKDVHLQVPGTHNALNAMAVIASALVMDLPLDDVIAALGRFKGMGRRFDVRGTVNGITVIDDYAHHPTEIQATLQAARQRYPVGRIWAVWQPHTYSRTHTLEAEFERAFQYADKVIVTDIYAAREPQENYTGANLVANMQYTDARYLPSFDAIVAYLLKSLEPGDVLLVLTAGNAIEISARVFAALQEQAA